MKRMRVIAQYDPTKPAIQELYSALAAYLTQNPIYGTVYGHDGTTEHGSPTPWGELADDVDIHARAEINDEGNLIDLMYGDHPVGAIDGEPLKDGTVRFLMDFNRELEDVGTDAHIDSAVKYIYDKLDADTESKDERAAEIAKDKEEAADPANKIEEWE